MLQEMHANVNMYIIGRGHIISLIGLSVARIFLGSNFLGWSLNDWRLKNVPLKFLHGTYSAQHFLVSPYHTSYPTTSLLELIILKKRYLHYPKISPNVA